MQKFEFILLTRCYETHLESYSQWDIYHLKITIMKKIFTFLFCTSILSSAFSQTNLRQAKYKNTNTSYITNVSSSPYNLISQRSQEIDEVNHENNYQVQLILNKTNLNIWDKRDILNNLEAQRMEKVNNIYARFNNQIAYSKSVERKNFYDKKPLRD